MRFYDLVQTEDRAFIVMELVAGGELFDRIVDPKYNCNVSIESRNLIESN